MLDTITGDQSVVKYLVLAAATLTRPANFDTAALTLPELTTSDMPVTIGTKTDPVSKMYGSPAAGADVTWAKPKPDQGSWTLSLSGNVQPTDPERVAMETMIAARGKYIWIERTMHTDTTTKGGCALVTSTGEPVPADGIVTFSVGLTGYGPRYEDTKTIV